LAPSLPVQVLPPQQELILTVDSKQKIDHKEHIQQLQMSSLE